ncbi:anthranilate phosphoribosyltransferase [Planococcus antarcticus DSM 14505]|uniref:Anthranilate phosphoribosyltransferase n=1 Tax=Planococcus antarcticus DSM 14505 TaxID=1185653 RepID=A0A1C7DCC5_9BACL|nr:anthranilate phosphoribosyltransferase [Planococcus antarcticus]ANU08923.1 anthranilate phosphoribosyltransferase [Planococcus antarcticus DSM 14505]EIM06533.1 anthranilate phosphoribosyltransferase [Planococcus antarcticus DSM 14505]
MSRVENLSEHMMYEKSLEILNGTIDEQQVKKFLSDMHEKGETADELVGLVKAMHEKAVKLPVVEGELVDVCGTGGDRSYSFNISTLTAFVLAGCGLTVAKHGNRSVSSKTGSSDVLEALGISTAADISSIPAMLDQTGIALLFAPAIHPALGGLRQIRKDIGTPTIFNLVGPLANPLPITIQMTGVYRLDMLEPMADALIRLGRKKGALVHGAGGLDELSLAGTNELIVFDEQGKRKMTIHPNEVGLEVASIEAIRGGDPERNAEIFMNVLSGTDSPYLDTVALNAGVVLYVSGKVKTVTEGVKQAKTSIKSGETERVFDLHRLAAGVFV